ncbi:MAG: conjugal transfer protein TraR [Opitutia bacterium]
MDDADLTQQREEALHLARIARQREKAATIPPGEPGDCELCGEWSGRLVRGVCAPCRDRRKLP